MAIPSSGPISLTTIQTEFGGTNPIGLNEYYAGGGRVPSGTSGTFGPVPSSGAISFQNFYGTSAALVIGQPLGGGFFAGQISVTGNGVATHNLVVGPKSSAQTRTTWGPDFSDTPGCGSLIDGPSNSASVNSPTFPAAFFCEGLVIGGFSDWYLPAINELNVIYRNLKPTTQNNFTGLGANINAVPIASDFTTGSPSQTSAASFQSGGLEAFDTVPVPSGQATVYWTSTNGSDNRRVWFSYFASGYQTGSGTFSLKTTTNTARAIRRIAI